MSSHKHTLRRHIPSGHVRQATPPPSPRPETPVKSDAGSIKSHHSKREKVKDAIEHFFDKFHHHHHHEHHHGSHDEQLAPPTTPSSKRKSFDSRSFKRGGSPTTSIKDKDMVVTVEVPSLSYESSSSTSSLQEKYSESFEQHASSPVPQATVSPAVIEASSSIVVTQEQAPAVIAAAEKADDKTEYRPQPEAPSEAPLPSSDEVAEAPAAIEEPARVDEPIETAETSRELPIEHEQYEPEAAIVASEGSPAAEHEAAASIEPSTLDAPTVPSITVTEPEIDSQHLQTVTEASADVIIAAPEEPEVSETAAEPQTQLSEPYVLVEAEQSESIVTEAPGSKPASAEEQQAVTEPGSSDATLNKAATVTHDSSAPLQSDEAKVTADSNIQTDEVSDDSSSIPTQPAVVAAMTPAVLESTPPVPEQHRAESRPHTVPPAAYSALAKTAKKASDSYPPASTSTSTMRAPPPRPSYKRTPPSIPLYPELRKISASMHQKAAKKPSWIRYVYNSFVKPVVSVATDCTVAVICYGLEKLLEARPPALREATSWIV